MNAMETNLSATEPQAQMAPATTDVHKAPVLTTMLVLVRREFWEHRVLWMAPLVIAVVLVACAFLGHVNLDLGFLSIDSDHGDTNRIALRSLMQWGLTLPQYIAMVIVLNFYLLDCLYAERRDRSILFWKSLPVSDGATVASKLLVALVVVPFGVYLLALGTNLLFTGIWSVRAAIGHSVAAMPALGGLPWLKVEGLMLCGVIISVLWYAPFAGYLLLVSAWARRGPILWASLPPLFAAWIESLAQGTHYVSGLFDYRMWGIWQAVNLESAVRQAVIMGEHDQMVSLSRVFDLVEFHQAFVNIDLWLGVAVTVGFAVAAARIRRHRDDT